MKVKKVAPLALGIVGAALLLFSNYIASEVAAGRLQITRGQQQLDTVDSVFSMSRYTKPFGKELTKSGQKKIDAGNAEVEKYESISTSLRVCGVILIAVGGGLFFYWKRKG